MNRDVAIITATTGHPNLKKCIESVANQQCDLSFIHVLVIDGNEYKEKVNNILLNCSYNKNNLHVIQLPEGCGKDKYNGHLIYAGFSYIYKTKYICFLDNDNWFLQNHLNSLFNLCESKKLHWAYSLRQIYDENINYICDDNCESLGLLHPVWYNGQKYLVDMNCYFIKREILLSVTNVLNGKTRDPNKTEPDEALLQHLIKYYKNLCTKLPTVAYMTGNRDDSVKTDFFLNGNTHMLNRYSSQNGKPWRYNIADLYIFHFTPDATEKIFYYNSNKQQRSLAMDEWQMTLLDDFFKNFNCHNGYTSNIPSGSIVYIDLWHPSAIPKEILLRKDIFKIGYLLESPNIRHQEQWNANFLNSHFDYIMTYWSELLDLLSYKSTFCRHNCHHLNFNNKFDTDLLNINKTIDKSICMLLERRDLSGKFTINNIELTCLDNLREKYIKNLKNIDVYGRGWEKYKIHPHINVKHTNGKQNDRPAYEYYKNYMFCIIIENTTADGYVSEKIYDAFIAGCIPIYYGNNNNQVGIPENMYIDLKKFETSKDLALYIENLSNEDIVKFKNNIHLQRLAVLKNVNTEYHFNCLKSIIETL